MTERRRHVRGYVPIATSVFDDQKKMGDYLVRNLSAGGALLLHGPALEPARRLQLTLRGPSVDLLSVDALVMRLEPTLLGPEIAVKFQSTGPEWRDLVQRLVLRSMERSNQPAVLVLHSEPIFLATMADGLESLGRRAALAVRSIEAMHWLGRVEALIVEWASDARAETAAELLSFFGKEFPAVRRILVCDAGPDGKLERIASDFDVHGALRSSWTMRELGAALDR